MTRHAPLLLLFLAGGCAGLADVSAPAGTTSAPGRQGAASDRPIRTDPQILNALIDTLEKADRIRVDVSQSEGTPLGDILRVGSPIGYELRNRFLNPGVPIAEALSRQSDPDFRSKLVTMARWDSAPETRSAALVALAQAEDPAHLPIFNEALVHLNPAVRFAALESLVLWNHPDKAIPLLKAASEKDSEPILRVYAAGGLARLDDPSGIEKLREFLNNGSWLVQAMAARSLGDHGTRADYDLLVSRMGNVQTNDFVLAEYCIAALKLFGRKS